MADRSTSSEVAALDFLPESYRRQRSSRQRRAWRRGVVAAFAILAVVGWVGQAELRRALEVRRDKLRAEAAHLVAQLETPDSIRLGLVQAEKRADLLSQLRVRTAPSRLLGTILEHRPEFVTLTSVRWSMEQRVEPTPTATDRPRPGRKGPAGPDARTPTEKDLERVLDERRKSALVVQLKGYAPDDVVVSKYLADLQQCGIFERVRLQFADRHLHLGHELRSFGVELSVRRPLVPNTTVSDGAFDAVEAPGGRIATGAAPSAARRTTR